MKLLMLMIGLLGLSYWTLAQERDDFKVDSLRLTRQYQPTLAEAVKVQLKPELPQFDAEKPRFQYKPLPNLTPTDLKVNPVGLSKSIIDPTFIGRTNRVLVGFGSYNTPMIGINLNTVQNKNWDLSLNARHINSSGSVDKEGVRFNNVNYGETMATIDGNLFRKDWRMSGKISFDRQAVRYYGVDSSLILGSSGPFSEAEAQHYHLFTIQASAIHLPLDSLGKNLHVSLLTQLLNDRLGQNEQQFQLKANGRVNFSDQLFDWNFKYLYANYQGILKGISRNMFHLSPRYVLKDKQWEAGLGLRLVYVGDSIESKARLFPDLQFHWQSSDTKTRLDLSFQGDVQANTFLNLMTQSPFVGTNLLLLNSPLIELKIEGAQRLSPNSSIKAILGYLRSDNWMFYKNDGPYLRPEYDPQTTQLSAEVRYQWQLNMDWKVEAGIRYRHFHLDTMQAAWQTPRWMVDVKAHYQISPQWQIRLEATGLDGIQTINLLQQSQQLGFLLDFSGRVSYAYNKKTSIFVQALNLASMRYVRWYNYPSYGLQVLAGLSIQF